MKDEKNIAIARLVSEACIGVVEKVLKNPNLGLSEFDDNLKEHIDTIVLHAIKRRVENA